MLAEQFKELFAGSEKAHGQFQPGEASEKGKVEGKKIFTSPNPPTVEMWQQHLNGERGIGIVPIDPDTSKCRWGAIDIDTYDLDFGALQRNIQQMDFPLFIAKSKSGGAHCYLFLSDWAPASKVVDTLASMAISLGYAHSELFPKQTQIKNGEVGNWLNSPYFEGESSTRYFLDFAGEPMTPNQFITIVQEHLVDPETLDEYIQSGGKELEGGPPCLQTMAQHGVGSGGRNNALFGAGVFFKKKYGDMQTVEEKLYEFNQSYLQPSLPLDELGKTLGSLKDKDYRYNCSESPLCDYCQPKICQQRKYGIGTDDGQIGVAISDPLKVDSDPPAWFITLNGIQVTLETDQIIRQDKFAKVAMERINVLPNRIKEQQWRELVNQEILAKANIVEAPEDVSLEGQLMEILSEFITKRTKTNRDQFAREGLAWYNEEDGYVYLQGRDLINYLRTVKRWNKMSDHMVWAALRGIKNHKHGDLSVKNRTYTYWALPYDEFSHQTEAYDSMQSQDI